ncbi:hypothetical protein [Sphingopyxis sp.]|uniref:hypothetical protein n=1 Tax=Sphingopyxis sp. TaxID=1908224 RepID=UPI003D0E2ED6
MGWTLWAAFGLLSAAIAQTPEMETYDAAQAGADSLSMQAPSWLSAMPAVRQREIRCVALAAMVMKQADDGTGGETYGLTPRKAETLGVRLTQAIMAERVYTNAEVSAVYQADSNGFLWDHQSSSDAEWKAAFDDGIAACQPLYDSIDPSGERTVAGLAPISPPDAGTCYAILIQLATATLKPAPDSGDFEAMATRVEQRFKTENENGAAADAQLGEAFNGFRPEVFNALPEPVAKSRIAACVTMAGE